MGLTRDGWDSVIDEESLATLEGFFDDATALKKIQNVIENEAPEYIKKDIKPLLPASGRRWKRKTKAASLVDPFKHETDMLSVTVKTLPRYHYLYFPDDGSNTKRHAGLQGFMLEGAENATPDVVSTILGRLREN